MPLCRLRQAVEAATARIRIRQEVETRLAETQAKVICTFIGASAGVWMDLKGGENPIVAAAQRIDFLAGAAGPSELDKLRGEKVADDWRDDPRFRTTGADPKAGVEAANSEGSFEAFMTAFGGQVTAPQVLDSEVNGSG